MKTTQIICDRCGRDYSDETNRVENFFIKVGGFNYVEDYVVKDKDYCRSCLSAIRSKIVSALIKDK